MGESSKKSIAFVTAVFKAFGSTVGVGEGDGDNVGVGVGDGEGEGEGLGAGAVCRNNANASRLHNTMITIAKTSVFFNAVYSPSVIWLIFPSGKAHARVQQTMYSSHIPVRLLLRIFPLKKLL